MKKLIYYTLCICIVLGCSDKEMVIEELKIDTSKGNYTFIDSIARKEHKIFILQNFCNCEHDQKIIDSLICASIEDKTFGYGFTFFKKSKISNIEHLTRFPRDLDRYSRKDYIMGISYNPKYKGEIHVTQYNKDKSSAITKVFKCEGNNVNYIK